MLEAPAGGAVPGRIPHFSQRLCPKISYIFAGAAGAAWSDTSIPIDHHAYPRTRTRNHLGSVELLSKVVESDALFAQRPIRPNNIFITRREPLSYRCVYFVIALCGRSARNQKTQV